MSNPAPPLPEPVPPYAHYRPVRRDGSHLYVSGQIAVANGEFLHRGRVGAEVSSDEGYRCAWQCGRNVLAAAKAELGDLAQIAMVLKVTSFVATAEDFLDHHRVSDGASDALIEALGPEVGPHARSAVGVARLPMDTPVEVEAVLLLRA